jgi:hypothetical protein
MVQIRNAYKILVTKPEEKRLHEIPRHKCEYNVEMCLEEMRWEDMDSMHLDQDRDQWWAFMSTVMNLLVSQEKRNFLTS